MLVTSHSTFMTPERWQQVERVLQAALEREPAARAALLERECAGDPSLRAEVESLLASAQQTDGFLAESAVADAAGLLANRDADGALSGQQFGPYTIQKQLGAGGMGAVYLAQDVRLGRKVALKLLDPMLTGDAEWRGRFLREARLASALDHPNICTIHEVGEAAGRLFIAMQYVEGETLREVIGGRPLSLDKLLSISLQVADGIEAAHSQGIIHRDIKAGNIIVTPRGQAKVLDFGLAKLLEPDERDTHVTLTGAVMGTPAAMSPEQARGERVDQRSDIFSLGAVLYEMATGQSPFKGRSSADVISALLTQKQIPAGEVNEAIPARLSAVIDRALCKEPDKRFQSMGEMIAELRQVITEAGGHDHLFNSSNTATMPLIPRRRPPFEVFGIRISNRAAVALLTVVIVLIGLALVLYRSRSRPSTPSEIGQSQSAVPIKSLAVLPFTPLVPDNRDEALELGMADTLIARLGNIREISVRPIGAVRKYMLADQDAVAAGREQKVDAVLNGSIQKAGNKVRVTVRLVRVGNGELLWTDQFDANMTDIFAVQDSISERVVAALALKLSGEEKELLTKRHTENSEAYRLYLLGRYHLNRLTDDGFRRALEYFQQAIDIDPNYALAYAGLADAYNSLGDFNTLPPKESYPRAKQAALKALDLDAQLAEAQIALATVKVFYDWDWTGAEAEFKRTIALNPGYSDAHQTYSYYLIAVGRFDEALKEMQQAHDLDPLSLGKMSGLGEVLYNARRYPEAIAAYQKTLEMDPNFGFAHWALGRAYIENHMYEQGIESLQKSIPLSGDSPDEPAALARAYALSGRKTEARKILDDLQKQARSRYVAPSVIASVYAALGEKDQAFVLLDQAVGERDTVVSSLKVDPMFDDLRSDPRFTDLLQRIGLLR